MAGSQPAEKNIIKLNTNENAYGPSPAVHQALASFDAHQLRKYSTLDQAALRQALSEQLGVPADQVIIGNGSDDILSMAFLAFFNSEEEVFVSRFDLWFLQGLGRPLPSAFSRNPTDS